MTEKTMIKLCFSADDLQRCAEREVAMRRRVYPRWVQNGRMSYTQAQEEIEKMQTIAQHFAELAGKERLL